MRKLNKDNIISIIWAVISITSLFIFFYFIHPEIILDFDDWSCITTLRLPLPLFNYWNPSRILPETLYPICGFIAGAVAKLFPSFGIIRSVSIVAGIILTFFVFMYEFLFMRVLYGKFNIPLINSELLAALFILLHFAFFRSTQSGNLHLFRSTNITCCFYYLVPAIYNCCMVFYLILHEDVPSRISSKIAYYLCLYLAIFSNQFASIILVSFCFFRFLFNTFNSIKSKIDFKTFILSNSTYILCGFMYLFSLLADGLGGRGQLSSSSDSIIDFSLNGFPPIISLFKKISILSVIIVLLCVILYFILMAKKKIGKGQNRTIVYFLLSSLLVLVLTLLLCSRVDPSYILRSEVVFGIFFFLIADAVIIIAVAISEIKYSTPLISLMLICVFIFTDTPGNTFLDSYSENIDSSTCYEISESLVSQVKDAISDNQSSVDVYVLESTIDPGANWPQNYMLSEYLPRMLKMFGVIDKSIEVNIVPDSNLNSYYGVTQW